MGLVAISHLYNAIFKAKGILGSLTLPLGIGLLSIFGALVVSGTVPRLVWYAFAATTLYDLGTHITTTFKDISRDEHLGILTTPLQIGDPSGTLALCGCNGPRFHYRTFTILAGAGCSEVLYCLGYFRCHCHCRYSYLTLFGTEREKRLFRAEGFDGGFYSLFSVPYRCTGIYRYFRSGYLCRCYSSRYFC